MSDKKSLKIILPIVIVLLVAFLVALYLHGREDMWQRNQSSDQLAYSGDFAIEDASSYADFLRGNSSDKANYYAVIMYEAIIDNVDEMKAGSTEISIADYAPSADFNEMYDYVFQASAGALSCLRLDNPELFWLDFSGVSIMTATSGSRVIDIKFTKDGGFYDSNISSQSQINSMVSAFENAVDTIIASIPDGYNDYQKVVYLNDYLVYNVEYDTTYVAPFVHTAYGALVNKVAVCDGYSYALSVLLDELNIVNLPGVGFAYDDYQNTSVGHAWSYVKLYDNWYGTDVTWNDPVLIGYPPLQEQEYIEAHKHDYLLKGGNEEQQTGFYAGGRIVQNYIFSIHDITLEFDVPTIMEADFVFPTIDSIAESYERDGDRITSTTLTPSVTGLVQNNTLAYSVSKDGGKSWSEYQPFTDSLVLSSGSDNGMYKFRIQTSKNGTAISEYEQVITVENQAVYSVDVSETEVLTYTISPNKDRYYQGETVTLAINNIETGYKITSITSQQVTISKLSSNLYSFTVGTEDIYINIQTERELYSVKVKDAGSLSFDAVLNKSQAYYQDEIILSIDNLPVGKKVEIVQDTSGQVLEISDLGNGIYQFVMPNRNVEIEIVLADVKYKVSVSNTNIVSDISNQSPVYGEEITIQVTLKKGQIIQGFTSSVENLQITDKGNNVYSFTMPAQDVSITFTVITLKYAITFAETEVVYNCQSQAEFDELVTINIISLPDEKYITNITSNVDGVIFNKISDNQYTFKMPAEAVQIAFELGTNAYNINIDGGGADVTAPSKAARGERVELNIDCPQGKRVKSISSAQVAVQDNGGGSYSFTMPAQDVSIIIELENIKYKVSVSNQNIDAQINIENAEEGQKIEITILNLPYAHFISGVTADVGVNISQSQDDKTFSFVMPASDVVVTFEIMHAPVVHVSNDGLDYSVDRRIESGESYILININHNKTIKSITVTDGQNVLDQSQYQLEKISTNLYRLDSDLDDVYLLFEFEETQPTNPSEPTNPDEDEPESLTVMVIIIVCAVGGVIAAIALMIHFIKRHKSNCF